MRRLPAALLAALLVGAASARDLPGRFDYWVLALSWSPQHCAQNLTDPQCTQPRDFVVHGLWPQLEDGAPEYCGRVEKLDDDLVQRMLPVIPAEKLIQYQWRKHGSCSGLPATEYFLTVERARRAIAVPPDYSAPQASLESSLAEIEARFVAVNPGLGRDQIAVQCRGRWLKEVRFCFDKDFRFRQCGAGVEDRCGDKVVVRARRTR